jgi:hypothetical protein
MKILVDLIHPANYHYFKYFIADLKSKGHQIIISAREKDVLQQLLILDGVDFISTGSGKFGNGALGKLIYLLYAEFKIFSLIIKIKPNLVISFASSPCAHMSFLLKIPHIAFEDTEHSRLNRKLYAPFTDLIITPECFYENIGKNHFRFWGYMELFYLHKNKFKPDIDYFQRIHFNYNEDFILLRFVSWEAFHDIGQGGLNYLEKLELVNYLKQKVKVYITSEAKLPLELRDYQINIPVNKIHDLLYFAKLYIGEGATMASESTILGVPAIYINSLPLMGYLKDEYENGLLYHLNSLSDIKEKSMQILNNNNSRKEFNDKKEKMLNNKIDPTALLIWLVEKYPSSKKILLTNPSYQNNFM